MFVQTECNRATATTTNNNNNSQLAMANSRGGLGIEVGASLGGTGNNNNDDFFNDLHLVSSFCTSVCSRDNDVRDVALDAIAKTVEDWLDCVGSPRHYQRIVSERNHRLQQHQPRNGLANGACSSNGTTGNYSCSSANGMSSCVSFNGVGFDVTTPTQTEEYVDLVALHLPILLRLAITCPFDNVREKCRRILEVVKERGIPVPYPVILGPSAFIDSEELPALGTFNEKTQSLYVDAFLQNNRLDHVSQVMGYHPRYLEHFLRTQHFILRGDGPLPYDYRHYIAIMAAGRHQCNYLITLQKQEFILQGGDHKWLKGLAHIPAKLRNLYDINKILAHRPWLLNMAHIEQLTKGKDSWSLAEVVHAIVILTHFHSLCSFVFSSGVNQELDQAGGYHYPGTGAQQHQQQQLLMNGVGGSITDDMNTTLAAVMAGHGAGRVVIEQAEEAAGSGGMVNGGVMNGTSPQVGIVAIVNDTRPEPISLSSVPTIPASSAQQPIKSAAIPAPTPPSASLPLPATPPSPTIGEPESVAMPITTLMQRMKTLSEQTQECTPGELAKRFEHVESQSAELGAVGGPHRAPAAEVGIFVHDPHFTYQDFAKRGEPQLIATFRVQDYSWDDHAYSLVNRLYNDVGSLLDDKFKTAYNLTYYTMGGRTDVDTSRFRRAIWNYIQCLLGIRHDDYDYGEINQLLERSLKTFIKSACCFPERVTKRDYDRVLREFKHSEKVHVNLMVLEARKQAELLYALRTVNRYMTN